MKLTNSEIKKFRQTIWKNYRENGRYHLPWRKTDNPYRILVSEIMLQQTQVERVIPKYKLFIKDFPSVTALSKAPLSSVITVWQGLGYNRRAVLLKKCAAIIVNDHKKRIPSSPDLLQSLPGIGHATANSIAAFVFNSPVIFLETNIRTVFIYFFLSGKRKIHDKQITPLIEQTLDRSNPREWYYALMDYGVKLKKEKINLNSRSLHYSRQSNFEGSVRQIRGLIIRLLSHNGGMTKNAIGLSVKHENHNLDRILEHLQNDGLIRKEGHYFRI